MLPLNGLADDAIAGGAGIRFTPCCSNPSVYIDLLTSLECQFGGSAEATTTLNTEGFVLFRVRRENASYSNSTLFPSGRVTRFRLPFAAHSYVQTLPSGSTLRRRFPSGSFSYRAPPPRAGRRPCRSDGPTCSGVGRGFPPRPGRGGGLHYSASTTTKAGASEAGITMSRSSSAATRSSSRNVCGIFPPPPEGRWPTRRTAARPERHFTDSFITVRLAIARVIATWLPRCPACHKPQQRADRGHSHPTPS